MLRLLLNAETIALFIELCDPISLWIADTITEDCCLVVLLCIYYCLTKHLVQSCTIEDIVAQYKASGIIINEFLTNNEDLG